MEIQPVHHAVLFHIEFKSERVDVAVFQKGSSKRVKLKIKIDKLACSVPAKSHGATLRPGGDPQGEKADQDAAKIGQKVRRIRHDRQTVSSVSTWGIQRIHRKKIGSEKSSPMI